MPVGQQILLNFTVFDMENHTNCGFDYLEIRDGASEHSPLIDQYCGGGKYIIKFYTYNGIMNWGPVPMPATNYSHLFLPIRTTQENAWLRYTYYVIQ